MADDQPQAADQNTQTPIEDQQTVPPEASQSASLNQPAVQPEQPQSQPQPQAPEPPPSTEAPQPPQEEIWPNSTNLAIPSLRLPFNGSFPVSLAFGSQPEDEAIRQKFSEWGIVGHHGIDFSLSEGTEVLAVSDGKVIQAGDNGDFGISVIIQHTWGVSLYAHLEETKVNNDQEVKSGDVIALSGQTGVAFGAHLHFGIKPNNQDQNNGYLGFIDPSSYFPTITLQKEEPKLQEQPQTIQPPQTPQLQETQKQEEQPQPQIQSEPQIIEKVIEKEVIKEVPVEVIKEVVKEIPIINQEEIQKQIEEKLKSNLDEKRKLANKERTKRKTENLQKIMEYAKDKRTITNEDIQKLLRVSQSTATNYLTELVNQGMLKKQGERKGTRYTY